MTLILASASGTRRRLLEEAGVAVRIVPPDIDERAAETPLLEAGATPADVATALALVKAASVSERFPGALVVGADDERAGKALAHACSLHERERRGDVRRRRAGFQERRLGRPLVDVGRNDSDGDAGLLQEAAAGTARGCEDQGHGWGLRADSGKA